MGREVILRNVYAAKERGMFHLGVIDTTTALAVNCKTHGLHLNSWGKRNLVLLIAKRLCDDHVLDTSIIPVYHPCKSFSFFTLKAKTQKCWRYIVCKYLDFREKDGSVDSSILALFIIINEKCRFIFRQNVGGLRSKIDELINCFGIDDKSQCTMLYWASHGVTGSTACHIAGFYIRIKFLPSTHSGVRCMHCCVKTSNFNKIYTWPNCKKQDLEIWAVKLVTKSSKLIILPLQSSYRTF